MDQIDIHYLDKKVFGQRIKAHREALSMSQADLAAAVGVGCRNISNYETGLACPTVERLYLLCKALNTSADQLLGLTFGDYSSAEYSEMLSYQHLDGDRKARADALLKALHAFVTASD